MNKRTETPIERLLRWASQKGWNQSALAKQMEVDPGHVTNWKSRGLPTDRYEQAADLFGRSVDELTGRVEEGRKDGTAGRAGDRLEKIPVIGTAFVLQEGYWLKLERSDDFSDGFIEMPSRDKKAFAIKVVGDAMHPRIKSGEYVVVEPGREVAPGDEVVVKLKDGKTLIRELLFRRNRFVALQSINTEQGRQTIAEEDIESIGYIAGIVKSDLFLPD